MWTISLYKCDIIYIGCENMSYEELMALLDYRLSNNIEPLLTEEEAMSYLGDEVINAIDSIYKFKSEYGFEIFTHGTQLELANRIIEKGYHWSSERITEEEFMHDTGLTQLNRSYFVENEENNSVKTYSLIMPRKVDVNSRGYYFEYDLSQHFVNGEISYAEFLTRFIAKNNNKPCNAILIGIFPSPKNTDLGYFEDRYFADLDEREGSIEFWHEDIIGKENFIAYVDNANKKVVFNPNFDPKRLLKNNPRAMAFDMSHDLDFISGEKQR